MPETKCLPLVHVKISESSCPSVSVIDVRLSAHDGSSACTHCWEHQSGCWWGTLIGSNDRMPITQDNALSILALLEDWQVAQSTRSQHTVNADNYGYKVHSPFPTCIHIVCIIPTIKNMHITDTVTKSSFDFLWTVTTITDNIHHCAVSKYLSMTKYST